MSECVTCFDCLIDLIDIPIAVQADPPSQRTPWENCRAVPSQQLPHVRCGDLVKRGVLHPPSAVSLWSFGPRRLCRADEA